MPNFAKAPSLSHVVPRRFGDPGHLRVKQLRTQKLTVYDPTFSESVVYY